MFCLLQELWANACFTAVGESLPLLILSHQALVELEHQGLIINGECRLCAWNFGPSMALSFSKRVVLDLGTSSSPSALILDPELGEIW